MKLLPFVLIAGIALAHHQSLAQTSPAEPASPSTSGARSTLGAAPHTTAQPEPTQNIRISALIEMNLMGQGDAVLGDIKGVVENTADKKTYVVVSRGGVLGFFKSEYLVPLDQIVFLGGTVIAKDMTPDNLESGGRYDDDASSYRSLPVFHLVTVPKQG